MSLEDKVERLEKKVENLEEEKKELRRETRDLREKLGLEAQTEESKEDISRRNFLKKIGAGAVGIGAISLAPAASQLKLTKNGIFGKNNNALLQEGTTDETKFDNNLNLSGKNLTNVNSIDGIDFTSHVNNSGAHHAKTQASDVDSSNWNDYEIQKNGSSTSGSSGTINFKT